MDTGKTLLVTSMRNWGDRNEKAQKKASISRRLLFSGLAWTLALARAWLGRAQETCPVRPVVKDLPYSGAEPTLRNLAVF
jgi:hypothetical protein